MKLSPILSMILLGVLVGQAGIAVAQDNTAHASTPWIGEVTGNDVYLRSGPSTNYYPVTKLMAGSRLEVFQEENGWLAVAAPEGVFSLIDISYVDKDQGNKGVVNGNRVNVRAGSELSRSKYAKQKQLDKGAIVTIIGEDDEGYYKIVPPEGVYTWISAQFVTKVPEERLKQEAEKESRQAVTQAVPTSQPAQESSPTTQPSDPSGMLGKPAVEEDAPDLSTTPDERRELVTKLRTSIEEIEKNLAEELKKPLLERKYTLFIEEFAPLSEQETDPYSQAWAKVRIEQLENQIELVEAVKRVRAIKEKAHNERRDFASRRANIRTVPVPVDKGFAAEGELRESRIYDSPNGPRRYRLIDPNSEILHTLCYVEIPRDMDFDPGKYLGRMVGVHAREKFLKADGVDPVPVIIAAEVVLLERKEAIIEPPATSADSSQNPDK